MSLAKVQVYLHIQFASSEMHDEVSGLGPIIIHRSTFELLLVVFAQICTPE